MSENTRMLFLENLKNFYTVFTGEDTMPDTITKFSDIKLKNYHKIKENCRGSNPLLERKNKGPITNKLFSDYAENLKKMIQITNKNQESLLNIINQLFDYVTDPQTKKKQIRVNPSLTQEKLQKIVLETRALIIDLYLSCEKNYVNGLKIYEAIVEQKIYDTLQNQKDNLEKKRQELIIDDEVPDAAELQEIKEQLSEKISKDKEKLKKQMEYIKNAEETVNKNVKNVLR
jgi:hypothetical protein